MKRWFPLVVAILVGWPTTVAAQVNSDDPDFYLGQVEVLLTSIQSISDSIESGMREPDFDDPSWYAERYQEASGLYYFTEALGDLEPDDESLESVVTAVADVAERARVTVFECFNAFESTTEAAAELCHWEAQGTRALAGNTRIALANWDGEDLEVTVPGQDPRPTGRDEDDEEDERRPTPTPTREPTATPDPDDEPSGTGNETVAETAYIDALEELLEQSLNDSEDLGELLDQAAAVPDLVYDPDWIASVLEITESQTSTHNASLELEPSERQQDLHDAWIAVSGNFSLAAIQYEYWLDSYDNADLALANQFAETAVDNTPAFVEELTDYFEESDRT